MLGMGAILAGMFILYWPLLQYLANRFVAPSRLNYDGRYFRPIQGVDQMVIMAILFVATVVVSAWVGRMFSSKEP